MKTFHKIVVLGSPRIGKTTILEEAVYGNKFRLKTHYEPTSEDIYCGLVEIDKKSREKVFFYDYAGIDNLNVEDLKLYLSFCDAFLLIYAKHDRNSYIRVKELKKNIDKLKEKKDIPVFVLAHQMRTDSQYMIGPAEALAWAEAEKVRLFEVDSLERNSVMHSISQIVGLLITVPHKGSFPLKKSKTGIQLEL